VSSLSVHARGSEHRKCKVDAGSRCQGSSNKRSVMRHDNGKQRRQRGNRSSFSPSRSANPPSEPPSQGRSRSRWRWERGQKTGSALAITQTNPPYESRFLGKASVWESCLDWESGTLENAASVDSGRVIACVLLRSGVALRSPDPRGVPKILRWMSETSAWTSLEIPEGAHVRSKVFLAGSLAT
jgi:hypothetical protein